MNAQKKEKKLHWWQLSLLGVACTVGTGFFLGSHLAIHLGGPGVLLGYGAAAFAAYCVFNVLARMTAEDPLEGSFRAYAKKAYGRPAGFASGWVYWSSELLIMGSQLTALSLFSRFWFPQIPMWVFAAGFGALGLLIVLIGTKGFERMENLFAVLKLAALVLFLVLAALACFGLFRTASTPAPALPRAWFPTGIRGLWASLIFAFYAYGGLEVMALMAMRLDKPEKTPKAGRVMLFTLAGLYLLSIGLVLFLRPWNVYGVKKSPFIVALAPYKLPFVPHLFHAVLIIGGFSTMIASIFAVTKMIILLAKDGDAPPLFASNEQKGGKAWFAMGLTAAGLTVSVLFSLLLPEKVYVYITTAASLMLLYNWSFILVTSGKLLKRSGWDKVKQWTSISLVALAVAGTVMHSSSRPGFFISLGFLLAIGGVTLLMRRRWKHKNKPQAEAFVPTPIEQEELDSRSRGRIR
ncbi:amino acid permease [Gorillibacterium sp. CAU 1737]|uniref:amino acid permease n=1 Tax=Gorillibacterium sp. CAU 1737 TaxID=3140362 RepID=UPI003261C94E